MPAPQPVKQVTHEPVAHAKEIAKRAEPKAPPAVTQAKRARRDAAESDARWVASVREALIHTPDAEAEAAKAPAAETAKAPAVLPARPHLSARSVPPGPAAPRLAQPAPVSLAPHEAAPALPPGAAVAAAPAPKQAGDHPVPPASIPDAAPPPPVAPVAEKHSSFRDAIAEIPLLGRMVGH